ncbi:MAG: autotransporter-associated beta strand repeat-containing protein, partial [Verrucomicrobiota bacterium]
MKNLTSKSLRSISAALGLGFALLANHAGAALTTWDPQGTTTTPNYCNGSCWYTGNLSGTWENASWDTANATGSTPTSWVENTAAQFAVHTGTGTPAFTVTMNANHTVAGIFDGSSTPNPCPVTINGTGTFILGANNLNGVDPTSNAGDPGSVTFNVVVAGPSNGGICAESGAGQTYLNMANTYSGGTYLGYSGSAFSSGIWNFNNNASFGTGPIYFLNCTGGALAVEGTLAITIPNAVTMYQAANATCNIVGNPAGVTFSGPWTLTGGGGGTGAPSYASTTPLASYGTLSLGSGGAANNLVIISGVMSGTNGFSKYGVGILELTATNTFSGPLTNSAGTLTIGGSGLLGSGSFAGAITNGGTFIYASSAAQTLSGVISGTGVLTQSAGTLILTAPNTYSGATTVSGGKLVGVAGGSCANSAVEVASGAGFGVSIPNNTLQWTCPGLTFDAGTPALDFNFGLVTPSASLAPLNVNGAATFNGTPTVTVEVGSLPTGIYPLMAWTSESGTAPTPTSVTMPPLASGYLSTSSGKLWLNVTANTQPLTWNNNQGNGLWDINSSQNWEDNTQTLQKYVDGDAVVFADTYINAPATVTLNTVVNPESVTAINSTYPYTISGSGGIAGSAGLLMQGNNTLTLLCTNTYTGGTTISAGTLQLGDGVAKNGSVAGNIAVSSGGSLVFANYNPQTYSGVISGTGSLTLSGPNTLTLNNANTYTGVATISAGVLQLGDGVAFNGSVAGNIADNASLVFANPNPQTYSAVISGTGTLTLSSPSTLTLSGVNTYTGNTTVSAGALTISSSGLLGNGSYAGNITNSGTFTYASSAAQTLSGVISGTGALTVNNSAANLTLTAVNTYTGTTTITAGALTIASPGQLGSGSYAGSIINKGTFTYASTAPQTLSGAISGSGTLIASNSLTLTGVSGTYTNTTIVTNGATLTLGGAALWTSGATSGTSTNKIVIASGSTFNYASTASQLLSGVISGGGALTLNSSPTLTSGNYNLTLGGANTYTGPTTINGGILQISSDANLGTAPGGPTPGQLTLNCGTTAGLRVSASFTLNANRGIALGANGGSIHAASGDTLTYNGVIAGTAGGNFSSGAGYTLGYGTIILGNNNTFNGNTIIAAGTLQLGVSGALPSTTGLTVASSGQTGGTFALNNYNQTIASLASSPGIGGTGTTTPSVTLGSGALTINGSSSTTFAGVISGTGSLALNGTGTLALTKASTYTGGTTIGSGTTLTIGSGGGLAAAGNILNNGTFNYNNPASATLSGTISGSGPLNVGGGPGCILTLSGPNSYTGGTTIQNQSQVNISSDGNLGATTSPLTLNFGFLRALNTIGSFSFNPARSITLGSGFSFGGVLLGGSIQVDPGITLTNPVAITGPSALMFGGGTTNAGFGTNYLTAKSTYAGGTGLSTGRLLLGANGALPYGTTLEIAKDGAVGAFAGAFFDLNGYSQTIGPLSSTNAFAGGAGTGTPTILLSGALTVLETNISTTFGGQIIGSGGSLTLIGDGSHTLTLTNANNTYTGPTTITNGTLALTGSGTVGAGTITVAGGATFDVSGRSSTLTLGASQTLSGPTAAGTATINAAASAGLTMGSLSPLSLPYFAPATPAINVTGGALTLAGGNPVTVTVANGGNPLPVGSYTLISNSGSGSVAGIVPSSVTVNGDGKAANTTASLAISGGALVLNIACIAPTTANAGSPQELCASTATLAGNTPTVGTGTWTLVSGSGTITSPNSPNSTVTGLGYGANTFQWTIHNPSCTDNSLDSSSTVTITQDQPPTTASVGGTQNLCGTGSATTAALGGNTPTVGSGAWSQVSGPGTATFSAPTSGSSTATVNAYGTYDLRWTISNGTCTPSTADVTVNFYQNPTASAGTNQDICLGGAVAIGGNPTASGGSGGNYTYSWSPATGLSSTTVANPTASPATTTLYTVTVTDGNGCTAQSSVTVSLNVAPTISTQPANQAACSGSTATFSVTASGSGLNYSWAENNNNGWGNNAWSVSGSGSTFLGNSTNNDFGVPVCNSLSAAYDINSPISGYALGIWGGSGGDEVATRPLPALTVGQVVSIDFDNGNVDSGSKVGFSLQTSGAPTPDVLQFYVLGGSSPYDYWYAINDGAPQDTGIAVQRTGVRVQFVLTSASAYSLIVIPCGGTAATFAGSYSGTIAQLKLFNQNTGNGDEENCYFNNLLVGGYTDNADNYYGDYAGFDQGNPPIASGNGSSTYTTPVLDVGDSGSQYEVVVYGCGGAVLSSAATVTVHPLPAVSVNSAAVCAGGSATLTATASGGASPYSYAWTVPAGAANPGNEASFSASVAGAYHVVVTDANGCTARGSGRLAVNALPRVTVTSPTVCASALPATITATASGATEPYSYAWTGPSGPIPGNGDSVSANAAGTYTVVVTDANGCEGTGSGALTVNANPTVTVASQTVCASALPATIVATPVGTGPFNYAWSGPSGPIPGNTASVSASAAGAYTVVVTDANGCASAPGSGSLTVNANPTVTVASQTVCASALPVNITATPVGTGPFSYAWTGPSGPIPGNTASVSASAAGAYTVVVTDANGCTGTGSGALTVNANPTVTVASQTVCASALPVNV